jgi:hypothetical protein
MLSTIRIDFMDRGTGIGVEPLIRVDIKRSDDPRDKLIKTLFQSIKGPSLQVSWSNPKWKTTESGELDTDTSVFIFKPEQENNPSVNIFDNSHGFRAFLDSEGIKWEPNEHSTIIFIRPDAQLFELGAKFAKYKEEHSK